VEIGWRVDGNVLFMRLEGEFDLYTAEEFRRVADAALKEQRVRHMVINLKDVVFIDSSGLGAILGRYKQIRRKSGSMGLVGIGPNIKAVLEISGIIRLIPVYDTEPDALKALRGGGKVV
jgi:stage II sporulation protein AA (anti-sigma F factor antagonist)